MGRHLRVVSVLLAAVLVAGWSPAAGDPSGEATFHLMKIVEVFPGTVLQPNAQFVEISAYAAGQNFTGGRRLYFFNAAGAKVDSVTLTNVPNGANQMSILFATASAQALFSLSADFTMPAAISAAGGKICFDATNIDCISWGNYSGSTAGVGTPFNALFGLQPGQSAKRRLDISGSASTLDALDDTQDSENDFNPGVPSARNNAGTLGLNPLSTCGNNVLEGLEQCDDGNTTPGDGCNGTCVDEFCGDGIVQAGEACDDGNLTAGDGCDPVCQIEPVCGNNVVEAGEECDDGNTDPGDGCDAVCQIEPVCGNNIVEAGEECDDGNTDPGDGCDGLCQSEASCPVTLTGDVNVSGAITSSDIISMVNFVFKGGAAPLPCPAAGDVNCNSSNTSADIIFMVNHVFKGGPVPCDVCTLVPGTWACP